MKDELLDETELYPFAEDEKGVSFLVSFIAARVPAMSALLWVIP